MAGLPDIAKKAGVTTEAVKGVFEAVVALTKAGEKVTIQGIGSFEKKHIEAMERPNPQKPGEKVQCPACDKLKFKASSALDMSLPKAAPAAGRRGR